MRNYVKKGDFNSFRQGLPREVSNNDALKLFRDIQRSQMGKKRVVEELNELKAPTLRSFKAKRELMPQRDAKESKKVWAYGVWPALDRLGGWNGKDKPRFKTKKGWKKYNLEQKEIENV